MSSPRQGSHPCPCLPSESATPTGIEAQVCVDIAARQAVGLRKYGVSLADNPAGRVERIRHAYQEALDLAVYLRWELTKAEAE